TPTSTSTHTPIPPSPTYTLTPVPPTLTPTITVTPARTATPTKTYTPTPVPVYARIDPEEGALIRAEPGFSSPTLYPGIMQGVLVQLLGNSQEVDGYTWIKILVIEDRREGWIMQSLLQIATPEPNW
ncbi:MAG TPA: hypothetical protein VF831_05945, partial [Anaerolineales bacterium]